MISLIPSNALKRAAVCAVGATCFVLMGACGGSNIPTDSGTQLSVDASIPFQVNIPEAGQNTVTFSGEAEGSPSSLSWEIAQVHYDGKPFEWEAIGSGTSTAYTFTQMGTFAVRFSAMGEDGQRKADIDTTAVLPYMGEDVEPILFFSYDEDVKPRLMRMSPTSPFPASVIAEDTSFVTNNLDKSPDGEQVVMSYRTGGTGVNNIVIFDLSTRQVVRQLTDTPQIAWWPVWSPTGEWIAYVDDSRIERQVSDEVALVRPDGTEQRYLSGEEPKERYWGFPLTWSPDGQKLAVGNARFNGEEYRRIAIIEEPWTEQPPRRRLHTEVTIQANVEYYERYLLEGGTGIAWSPDGTMIAYSVTSDYGTEGITLALAPADGSGPIKILPYGRAYSPSWSPDGNYLVFRRFFGADSHLILLDAEGRNPVDLSRLRTRGEIADDVSPEWH